MPIAAPAADTVPSSTPVPAAAPSPAPSHTPPHVPSPTEALADAAGFDAALLAAASALGTSVLATPAALLAMPPSCALGTKAPAPASAPSSPSLPANGADSPQTMPRRAPRGALVRMTGLPVSHAQQTMLRLARGVPYRLALLQLGANGRPAGGAYLCVSRVRDARSLVGSHQLAGARQLQVALATPADVRAGRQEYVCVLGARADSALGLSGRRGADDAASRPLGLAETLHEGARVTASMAAAAVEELLGMGGCMSEQGL
jgi:hypothetical protein